MTKINTLFLLGIAGVDSLNLCLENCTWLDRIEVPLYPWDAGTDSGKSFPPGIVFNQWTVVFSLCKTCFAAMWSLAENCEDSIP